MSNHPVLHDIGEVNPDTSSFSLGRGMMVPPGMKASSLSHSEDTPSRSHADLDLNRNDACEEGTQFIMGKRRNNSSHLEDDVKEKRRRKHNELEVRRRKRINQKFSELQAVCRCKGDRRSILQSAIDEIRQKDSQIMSLSLALEKKAGPESICSPYSSTNTPAYSTHPHLPTLDKNGDVFQNASIPMGIVHLDGRIISCNLQMTSLLETSLSDLQQTTIFGLMDSKDISSLFSKLQNLINGSQDSISCATSFIHPSGFYIPIKLVLYAVRENGTCSHLTCVGIRESSSDSNPKLGQQTNISIPLPISLSPVVQPSASSKIN